MRYRLLGNTGIEVSEIGFGGWGIGGVTRGATSYGETDDDESRRALQLAFDSGVTFYDTSDIYGDGRSECLIGETFKATRQRVVIASKVGFLYHDGPQDFSATYIRQAVDRSLRWLQTDYLDCYQLHNPPISLLQRDDEAIATLQALLKGGKIRAIGISTKSPHEALAAVNSDIGIHTVQVNFNLADQRALEFGLFARCAERGIGVIARTPLCFGFLTGQYTPASTFDPRDHRSTRSPKQRALWANATALFRQAIRDARPQTPAQIALRYCLSYPEVSVTIPGMLIRAHVLENTKASDLGPLSEAERRAAEEIYQQHTFFLHSAAQQ